MTLFLSSIPSIHPSASYSIGRVPCLIAVGLVAALSSGCGGGGSGGSGDPAPTDDAPAVTGPTEGPTTDTSGGEPAVTDSSGNPTTDSSGGALADSTLSGSWDQCSGGGTRNTYTFTENRFDLVVAVFESADCSGEPNSTEGSQGLFNAFASGTYVIGAAGTSEEGVAIRAIDFVNDSAFGVTLPEALRVTNFDIVHTGVADQLVFGRRAGDTAEDRPTALDFNNPYRRR